MINSKEFAQIVGVSQSTVSRALNDSPLVSKETKAFIKQKAQELGFVLNSQARSLKTNRTGTVGILFPKHFIGMHANMMLAYLYDSIQRELSKYGYDIMVIYNHVDNDGVSLFEKVVRRRKVDGFIILRLDLSRRELQLVKDSKIPCVLMMNASRNENKFSYCLSDSEYGGYLAGKFLGAQKEYQIVFLSILEETEDASRRFNGFRKGLLEEEVEINTDQILYCDLSIESAYQCMMNNKKRLMKKKTAIFAYNDIVAIGALNAIQTMGLGVPDDVQIIGMDDIPLSRSIVPRLSTLHVPVEDMAPMVSGLLRDLIENPETKAKVQTVIKPQLVLRDTTKSLSS